MLRRFHSIWCRGIWGAIACIIVVCALARLDAFAMSNLREQCFANDDPAAQEACRSYVEGSHLSSSDIISLGRELEKQLLFDNAVVVYKQGLRYHPQNEELLRLLQMAESNRNEATSFKKMTPDTDTIAVRLARIACTRLNGARALEACQRATALDPNNATLYERLGDVLTASGRNAEASEAYQKARRLGRVNAGSTGNVQAAARPERAVPIKPPTEAVPPNSRAVSAPAENAPLLSSSSESKTLLVQMQLLDQLKKEGFISIEEYSQRKKKLLDTVFKAQPISIPEQPARVDDDRSVLLDVNLGNFYALVIGNNDYKNIQKLKSAIADAKAVGTLLGKEYGFRVTELFNANRYQILSALSDFRTSLSKNDSLLIYYAGHGILDEDIQRGYWLPIDAEAMNTANWLSTTAVIDQVHGMRALHVLVIADSCFSGTLVRRGLSGLERATDQSNADRRALIRRLATKRSRTVLTSGGLEPVLDSGGGQHSVFTRAFLNTLSENQGVMEGTRLFQKLRELVVYNADQTPEYAPVEKAGHEGGDFIFVRQP